MQALEGGGGTGGHGVQRDHEKCKQNANLCEKKQFVSMPCIGRVTPRLLNALHWMPHSHAPLAG